MHARSRTPGVLCEAGGGLSFRSDEDWKSLAPSRGGREDRPSGGSEARPKPGVLEGRSSQVAPASLAGLSAPRRHVAEVSRTGQF